MALLCDEVVGEGRLVGAVNAVRRDPDGRLVGDLFDGQGFVQGLAAAGHTLAGKRVFMFGAGGAGNAVAFALARAGVAALTIHNRTRSRADDLIARLQIACPSCETRFGAKDARASTSRSTRPASACRAKSNRSTWPGSTRRRSSPKSS